MKIVMIIFFLALPHSYAADQTDASTASETSETVSCTTAQADYHDAIDAYCDAIIRSKDGVTQTTFKNYTSTCKAVAKKDQHFSLVKACMETSNWGDSGYHCIDNLNSRPKAFTISKIKACGEAAMNKYQRKDCFKSMKQSTSEKMILDCEQSRFSTKSTFSQCLK